MAYVSNVAVSEECSSTWNDIQDQSVKVRKWVITNESYIIKAGCFWWNSQKSEVVLIEGTIISYEDSNEETWNNFTQSLPSDECRFAFYSLSLQVEDEDETINQELFH